MSPVLLLTGVGLVVLILLVTRSQSTRDEQRIQAYLAEKGATKIVVLRQWFDRDRDTHTYDVEFTNKAGQRCQSRCKTSARWLRGDEIYWLEPLDV